MKLRRSLLLSMPFLAALVLAHPAFALAASPAGVWRTIDDNTHKPRSLVRIVEVNGQLQGKVEKVFAEPGADPAPLCAKCEGERNNKPIVGMTILWGMKKKDDNQWKGGEILDPKNGKTYSCKITLSDDGQSLTVRGFVGLSLLGRSQTWQRVE
jgi:uncharacterized protein (DUF2147 family)